MTFFFFVPASLLFILALFFLRCSSVSLSYSILAVPMREYLEKHSCISSSFPTTILKGTFFFHETTGSKSRL